METVIRVEQTARPAPVPALPPGRLSRVAGWSAYASGTIGAFWVGRLLLAPKVPAHDR
jgi:hypothetical protein